MKRIVLVIGLLALAGCAGNNRVAATMTIADSCEGYARALDKLTPMRAAGELTADQIKSIDTANSLTDPVCKTGLVPTDETSAVNLVLQETQVILAIVGVHV